jgi:hypothetical protein
MSQYGPNSELVDQFLARLARLDHPQMTAVVAIWRDGLRRTDLWYGAEDDVGDALTATRRHDEEWRLQERLYELFRRATWRVERTAFATAPDTEAAAQYLATTAAFALMVSDVLSAESLGTLYAPFADSIPLSALGLGSLAQRKARRGADATDERAGGRDTEHRERG